jgi:hypothetical protein
MKTSAKKFTRKNGKLRAKSTPKKPRSVPENFKEGWLPALDKRTAISAEMRTRFVALTNDLGGSIDISYAQRSLCERALWLEYWLSKQEQALANGTDFNVGGWIQGCNSLLGILSRLGLKKKARTVSLNDVVSASKQ